MNSRNRYITFFPTRPHSPNVCVSVYVYVASDSGKTLISIFGG